MLELPHSPGQTFRRKLKRWPRLCWLLSLALVSPGQETDSLNPATRELKRWIAAYDASDWETYRDFLRTDFAPQARNVFQDRALRRQTGAFDLIRIEKETANETTALLNGRESDKVGRVVVRVEEVEPHRIVALQAQATPRTPDLALPHLDEKELVASLRHRMHDAVLADSFSGAVLVAKDGKPIFAEAYGLADREHQIPNSLTTRFRIGSMNKMFTAVAVLQLVKAGKIALQGPVVSYLPDYPNHELASNVTISELLSHTGGTGDFFGPEFNSHRLELRTHEDYITLFGKRPVRFKPGTRFEYSNYGFLILGAIIDKVSGQTYYDYVRDHVYGPAGMTATGSEPEGQPVPELSIGYTRGEGDPWQRNTFVLPYRGTPAGGGYSTVGDLLRFATALRDRKLLDKNSSDLLTAGRVENVTFGGRYAYGFQDQTLNGSSCFGHAGGSPGMNGELEICQDSKYVVAVLANMDPEAASHIAEFIANRLPVPASGK